MSELEEVVTEIENLINEHLEACPEDTQELKQKMYDMLLGTDEAKSIFYGRYQGEDYPDDDFDDDDDLDDDDDVEDLILGKGSL